MCARYNDAEITHTRAYYTVLENFSLLQSSCVILHVAKKSLGVGWHVFHFLWRYCALPDFPYFHFFVVM